MGGELILGGYLLPISAHVWVMGRMGGLKTAELWGAWGVTPMAKTRGDGGGGICEYLPVLRGESGVIFKNVKIEKIHFS